MKYIKSRTTPLSLDEISEFLNDHLRYRVKILDTLIVYPYKYNSDPHWPSIYESAQIVCRMFIEFFGLGVDGSNTPKLKKFCDYYSKDGKTSFEVNVLTP